MTTWGGRTASQYEHDDLWPQLAGLSSPPHAAHGVGVALVARVFSEQAQEQTWCVASPARRQSTQTHPHAARALGVAKDTVAASSSFVMALMAAMVFRCGSSFSCGGGPQFSLATGWALSRRGPPHVCACVASATLQAMQDDASAERGVGITAGGAIILSGRAASLRRSMPRQSAAVGRNPHPGQC